MTGGFENAAGKQGFQFIWNKAKEFFEDSQKQSQFFSATQKYYEHYQARHGIVKVLGMREPTNLDSIYTVRHVNRIEGLVSLIEMTLPSVQGSPCPLLHLWQQSCGKPGEMS